MTTRLLQQLQEELHAIASTASAPLMAFLDFCEKASPAEEPRFRKLGIVVGHELKAIARINLRVSMLVEAEPAISDRAIMREIQTWFLQHMENFESIAMEHGLVAEMEPFIRMSARCIAACEVYVSRASTASHFHKAS